MIRNLCKDLRAAADNHLRGGPKGTCIYSHPTQPSFKFYGYHGTSLDRVVEQLVQGRFENRNKDIYFVPHSAINAEAKAAFWSGNADGSILLEIGSNQSPIVNQVFSTKLFARGNEQEVFILGVWEVSPDWRARVWDHKAQEPLFHLLKKRVLEELNQRSSCKDSFFSK